jgi:hypothetical protein
MDRKKQAENKQKFVKLVFGKYKEMWAECKDDRCLVSGMFDQLWDACEAMKKVDDSFVWCAFNARFAKQYNNMCEIVGRFTGEYIEKLHVHDL